jgi:hypothetical protein
MLFTILVIAIVVALTYAISGNRALNLNERLYLRRRGYEPPIEVSPRPLVSKDTRLFSLIESLGDVSPYARRRAAEDLSRMCASGHRDSRMQASLIKTLDDSDASVRGAAAIALGNLGDSTSLEPLRRRMDVEESIHVRASLQQSIERLSASPTRLS